MSQRLGFVGIIIHDRRGQADRVNALLSSFGHLILARTGLPSDEGRGGIITLIVNASTDDIGQLTGRLGMIDGVTVKSGLMRTTGERKSTS